MNHQLLQQHLQQLGIDPNQPPTAEQWALLQSLINVSYTQADTTREQWQAAYETLRQDMEGSFETLRRSSANLLRGERDKLQSVIESLGEGLISLNENGCLLFMNPEAEAMLGWEELDVRGQLILDWIMPSGEEETTTDKLLTVVRQGNEFVQDDAIFINRSGNQVEVAFNLNPVMREGVFSGAVLAVRKMAEFRQTQRERERKLQETLLLNRVIGATTSTLQLDMILHIICEELSKFLALPQAAFALLSEDKLHMTVVAEYLEAGRIPALGEIIPVANNPATQHVLETGEPLVIADAQNDPRQSVVHGIARKRGTRSMLLVPVLVRGRVLGTLGLNATLIREFTEAEVELAQNVAAAASQAVENAQLYTAVQQELAERQATEHALAQARDKALEASRLKSELIAKVSHELRTPLTAIMGFAEMLALGVYGDIKGEQLEVMNNILQSTDNLVVLVNDLLDVAQLEAGVVKLNYEPFEPRQLIDRMESTMRILAEGKGLALISEISPGLPHKIVGDVDRLHQIVINFVNNAVKFTQQGFIKVTLATVNTTSWSISVQDSGIGIPQDKQEMVFDQFQQVRFSATRDHRGIGLGLSIVKQLVGLMKGTIKLESEMGEGSLFTVTLPLILEEEKIDSSFTKTADLAPLIAQHKKKIAS